MRQSSASPYEEAIGDRMAELHPRLRAYFSSIPADKVGVGEGVFERFGTRRRWLAPLLAPLRGRGVIVPGWHRDVAFRVENRTVSGVATARRTLSLPAGAWTMVDAVRTSRRGGVVDQLGSPRTIAARFDIDVVDGELRMTSRAVGIKLGRARLRLPRSVSPRVRLTERYDDASDEQRVHLTIDVPVLGRVYEYEGSFTYRIEEDA